MSLFCVLVRAEGASNAWRSRLYSGMHGAPPAAAVEGRTLYAQAEYCGYLPLGVAEHFFCGIPAADQLEHVPPGCVVPECSSGHQLVLAGWSWCP